MNILVVGGGSWDDTSSLGNTFSNFFANWENANFYNLYFRNTRPNNSVCENYFKITTKELAKKIISPKKIGEFFRFSKQNVVEEDIVGAKEKRAISVIHKYNLKFVYDVEDLLWSFNGWKNKNLDEFIELADPDVIFTFAAGNVNITRSVEYIKSKTNAKLVLLVADDIHTAYRLSSNRHHKRLRNGLDRMIGLADKVYGISRDMCDYYHNIYGVDMIPLYKGCSFENEPMPTVNKPIKIVYAGNLQLGRFDTIVDLIQCLDKLNHNGISVTLDVYSATLIDDEQREQLNFGNISKFHGGISYNEVKKKMSEADIVLHVESFDKKEMEKVRYSFSTKIIDCLQSGSVMLAIGPEGISSIEYPKEIPGAIVVDNLTKMYDVLNDSLENEKDLVLRAEQIRSFAIERHSIDNVRKSLQQNFIDLCNVSK